jgi:hypothetical protein
MRTSNLILFLFLIFAIVTFISCVKCRKGDMRLDESRSWLPLKGKTELTFLNRNAQSKSFALHVIDTLQIFTDSTCNMQHKVEYIQVSLYLNSQRTDSIFIQLSPPSSLFVRAFTDTSFNMGIGGFLTGYGGSHGNFKDRLYNYNNGNKIYQEALLIKHAEGSSDSIDSLLLARNAGIIGFNYLGEKYILE